VNIRDTVLGFRARKRFLNHIARLDLPSRPVDVSPVTEADVAVLPDRRRGIRSAASGF
jgi:hypothetical protein